MTRLQAIRRLFEVCRRLKSAEELWRREPGFSFTFADKTEINGSSSLKKLPPTNTWLKGVKQNTPRPPGTVCSTYTVQQKRVTFKFTPQDNWFFFFFLRFTFSSIFSDMPRHHFGHFINNIKTEKGKGCRKEGQLIYVIWKPSTPISPLLHGGPKPPLGQVKPLKIQELFRFSSAW